MIKRLALILLITASAAGSAGRAAAQVPAGNAQVLTLLVLQDGDAQRLAQVQSMIQAGKGQTLHVFPYQAIIAQMPIGALQELQAQPQVAAVFTRAVDLTAIDHYGPEARRWVSVWNDLVRPATTTPTAHRAAQLQATGNGDALVAPDLGTVHATDTETDSVAPGYFQTSEYMAGSVAVGIILVESNGRVDPSTEDWTSDEKQLVVNKIVAGLNWWARLEPRAHLSFVYDDHFSNPLPTDVEPISRPSYDQQYWVGDAMSALGYHSPSYFSSVRSYNHDLRALYHTHWAFTIFVVNSSNDSDGSFSDGYFAYAYLGGPFMVMTYKNGDYGPGNMDAVATHEMGHIFFALDQYYSAAQPCYLRAGYLAVENQNSQYGGCALNTSSIMRGQVFPFTASAIDPYAAGQVGWRDSDSDDILDPLDVELPVTFTVVLTQTNHVSVTGTARIVPFPSPSRPSVTINTLSGVQYRFDEGDWWQAAADDGTFDETREDYHLSAALSPGRHVLEVSAVDTAGNVSSVSARQTITILDPADGGLITELDRPSGDLYAGQPAAINGAAYDLSGSVVAGVQYRVNEGAWQSAAAQDGAFDSDHESFAVTINLLVTGTYKIEAFASNMAGQTQVNFASRVFTVTAPTYTVFLPFVAR